MSIYEEKAKKLDVLIDKALQADPGAPAVHVRCKDMDAAMKLRNNLYYRAKTRGDNDKLKIVVRGPSVRIHKRHGDDWEIEP